jgi:hypothetical protein
MSLRGRVDECASLDDFAGAVRRGESRSLVVRGEAGIGKTVLLDYLVASSADLTILRATGAGARDRVRAERRRGPGWFLVGLGLLSLLFEAAHQRPLLCVVDDAQWLDQASALTLAFVGRRLLAEPVGIVFAAREPGEELRHISELEVLGLRNGDARALLSSAVHFGLDEPVRDRIIAEMRGNPLALLELHATI